MIIIAPLATFIGNIVIGAAVTTAVIHLATVVVDKTKALLEKEETK